MAAIANVETAFAQRGSQDIVLHDIKSRAVLGGGFEDRLHRRRDARIGTRARDLVVAEPVRVEFLDIPVQLAQVHGRRLIDRRVVG